MSTYRTPGYTDRADADRVSDLSDDQLKAAIIAVARPRKGMRAQDYAAAANKHLPREQWINTNVIEAVRGAVQVLGPDVAVGEIRDLIAEREDNPDDYDPAKLADRAERPGVKLF